MAGILLCLVGTGVVYYQISESCEDSTLAGAYKGYPWCTDVLDQINLTFLGVLALLRELWCLPSVDHCTG